MSAPRLEDRLDRPLTDLRISVTDRCNFRCSFCMPADREHHFLPREDILTYEETVRLAAVFQRLGVEKIRLTGGEPLLRRDLEILVERLAALGPRDLALTTNGALLGSRAAALAAAGLRRVTVSLHSLRQETFERVTGGRGSVAEVLDGIAAARAAGLSPIKVNCVVIRGVNDGELVELAERFRGTEVELRFIEYMDVGTVNGWRSERVVEAERIAGAIDAVFPLEELPRPAHSTSRTFRYRDGAGDVGIVASVSSPFCSDCSRARLSCDGRLFTCLFTPVGHDLKTPLRSGASDDELGEIVAGIWARRRDRYSEERASLPPRGGTTAAGSRVEMYRIGG